MKVNCARKTQKKLKHICVFVVRAFMVLCLMSAATLSFGSVASATTSAVPLRADISVLHTYTVRFWQEINEARRNPLAAAVRLGVPEETVRVVFSDRPWILEQGLPPLAWSDHLRYSAAGHGRDMFDRLYYNYVSPDGTTYDQRIADTGYDARMTGESINALFFSSYVSIEVAYNQLLDALIRDELAGHTAVYPNVFEPGLTEIGIAFFAESVNLLGEQPFVYLLVADFAAPQHQQSYVVGVIDEDSRLAYRSAVDGIWRYAELPAPGLFQLSMLQGGLQLATVTLHGLGPIGAFVTVEQAVQPDNQFIDLRQERSSVSMAD